MPKSGKGYAVQNYTLSCGLIKNVKERDERRLKLFYKLHQKKCSICSTKPYNMNSSKSVFLTRSKDDMKDVILMTNGLNTVRKVQEIQGIKYVEPQFKIYEGGATMD